MGQWVLNCLQRAHLAAVARSSGGLAAASTNVLAEHTGLTMLSVSRTASPSSTTSCTNTNTVAVSAAAASVSQPHCFACRSPTDTTRTNCVHHPASS
jgi:hypothetical protein